MRAPTPLRVVLVAASVCGCMIALAVAMQVPEASGCAFLTAAACAVGALTGAFLRMPGDSA